MEGDVEELEQAASPTSLIESSGKEDNQGEEMAITALEKYLGVEVSSEVFGRWRENNKELSDIDILLGCLYNKVTREQSKWAKRDDLPEDIMGALSEYLHTTSEAAAEVIVTGRVGENLQKIEEAKGIFEGKAKAFGVNLGESTFDVEPETTILSFKNLINQSTDRPFLGKPLLIVGLITHGNIPAYVVSKLISQKGIDNSVVLVRPTSRDNKEVVKVSQRDKITLEEYKKLAPNVLIVDDSIDKGGSMQQAIGFIKVEFPGRPITVCPAVSRKVPFLEEIESEEYKTVVHEGETIYPQAAFFRARSTS